MRTSTAISLAVAATLTLIAASAEARHIRFLGPHPIVARLGGGYCYIEAPHLHAYAPDHAPLYQQVGDGYVFTGDPTPFGYDGERHVYYGHHPIAVDGSEPVYCLLHGPHYHPFAPDASYRMKKGVAFYMGGFAPAYARAKHRVRVVNAEYRPYAPLRPIVEVEPPPDWQGEVVVVAPSVGVSAPGVMVRAPGVMVSAPGVTVSAPGVTVSAPGVYVAPPRVRVAPPDIYLPAPRVIGPPPVLVGGSVIVERHRHVEREDRDEWHEHHDNGKHNGWHKRHGED